MKRLAILSISLLLSLAAFGGTSAAFAEEADTRYPDDEEFTKTLSFSDLKDYEIEGDTFYFLDGETNYKYESNTLTVGEQPASFSPEKYEVSTDGYLYYFNGDALLAYEKTEPYTTTKFEGYSLLKEFNGAVYAVRDNTLYSIDGANEPAAMVFEYFDPSAAQKIPVGQTADSLTQNYELKFATVKEGAYITEADLSFPDGCLTSKDAVTVKAEKDMTALILCYTGNAAVISVGDKCYVTKLTPADEIDVDCYKAPSFIHATVTGSEIYASPYVVKGTSAVFPAAGMQVKILNKLELEGVLGTTFYEIEYTVDEQKHVGYVTEGLVTEYLFGENKEPASIPDPAHSEKNNVTTVVLVLIVITLVLVAAAYLTYAGTLGKLKSRKKKNEGTITEE
ncbi:MAG: hypothetical protein K2K60_02120 [Clostridia bacterium]|nr:hypothetical protein [Clostridia bacterium]